MYLFNRTLPDNVYLLHYTAFLKIDLKKNIKKITEELLKKLSFFEKKKKFLYEKATKESWFLKKKITWYLFVASLVRIDRRVIRPVNGPR